jgi:hypothetical protein
MELPPLCIDMIAGHLMHDRPMLLDVARDAASLACVGGAVTTALAMSIFRLLDPDFAFFTLERPVPVDVRARKLTDLRAEARSLGQTVSGTKADLAERIDEVNSTVWEQYCAAALANRWCPVRRCCRSFILAQAYIIRDEEEGEECMCCVDEYHLDYDDMQGIRSRCLADGRRMYSRRDLMIAAYVRHGPIFIAYRLRRRKEALQYLASQGGVEYVIRELGPADALTHLADTVSPAVIREIEKLVPEEETKDPQPVYKGTSKVLATRLSRSQTLKRDFWM